MVLALSDPIIGTTLLNDLLSGSVSLNENEYENELLPYINLSVLCRTPDEGNIFGICGKESEA